MRQTVLMLAIAIGSPLAMAQAPGVATTPVAATAAQSPAPKQHPQARRAPTSAIGRALAQLLSEGTRQPATSGARDADADPTIDASATADLDAAHRDRLATQDAQTIP
jgi:hypothetical protein